MTNHEVLNKAQRHAVQLKAGPTLVVAGAGTGKTRVIVERIRRLIADSVPPERILALTFTEKAASEMQDRVNEALGSYQLELAIATFNSYGEGMLRSYAADSGLSHNFKVMGENAVAVFLRERVDELGLDYFAPIARPDSQIKEIRDYFSKLKQNVVTPALYEQFLRAMPRRDEADELEYKKYSELCRAYKAYQVLAKANNVIDYDDQLYLLIELMQTKSNVRRSIANRYDFVMIDEFQDTNRMQSVLVDMLAEQAKSLFVVGDDDQSIYGWRGATLANILDFKQRYPKAEEVTLTENYRSTKQILDSAYRLIQANNPHRLEVQLSIDKRLTSKRNGPKPSVYNFETIYDELGWVTEDIGRRIAAGTRPGDIAVLMRRNAGVDAVHDSFAAAELPHVVIGQTFNLYHEPVVRHLLEGLKAVVEPTNNTSLYHLLTGPLCNLSVAVVSEYVRSSKETHRSLWEVLQEQPGKEVQRILKLIHAWRDKSISQSVRELTYALLEDSGYKDQLYNLKLPDQSAIRVGATLLDLFQTMKEFESVALQPSALQYVDALPVLEAADSTTKDDTLDLSSSVINVLSIHKAKGLEWPIVYILDCSEGSFPLAERAKGIALPEGLVPNDQQQADSHMAEERRLMYVAMTRAKDELILTHAAHHYSNTTRKPSRFLIEAFGDNASNAQTASKTDILARLELSGSVPFTKVDLPGSLLKDGEVTLSISQVKVYQTCPLDFYYRYVLQVPEAPNSAAEYGSIMHHILETINKSLVSGKLIGQKELEEEFRNRWPRTGFQSAAQRDRALKQGLQTLKTVHARSEREQRTPLAVEQSFKIQLPDYRLSLRGRFDAVFPDGEGVEIVDYKTGNVETLEKAKARATASEQLTLYALAWQYLHGEMPTLVTLDFIDAGLTGSVKKTARGISGAANRLQAVADGIRAEQFGPGRDHRYCHHPEL